MKAGVKKSRKTGSWRAETPKPYLWYYGLGHLCHQPWSHSPEIGFSKRGLPHFPGIFQGANISDNKFFEIIVCFTTNLPRPGEIILQPDVQCGPEELVSKRPGRIPSLPDGRFCRDFHLVTQNQNTSQTSTASVEKHRGRI